MKHHSVLLRIAAIATFLAGALQPALAYPPAPHHLFYGTVRDEQGNPLAMTSADVILETSSGTVLTTKIVPGLRPGVNYELPTPMDSGITEDLYRPTALKPMAPFTIRVRIGGTLFVPIEISGDFMNLGQPGAETRLDLTLGEDLDGDGLPDAWERAIANDLASVDPNADSDGDGISNIDEYRAGSYAFDPTDGFALQIEHTEHGAVVKFLAIRGRYYTLHASSDLRAWQAVPFWVAGSSAAAPLAGYSAADTRLVEALPLLPDVQEFQYFKLMAR